MNLQNLSSDSLLKNLKFSVSEERRHLNIVLHHLREVERRKLHLEMGYPNLYAFATKELGYAEASAHRRISAMRLMKELPDVEEKLMSGSLTLSAVSLAQTHFRKEKVGLVEKQEIVKNLEGKSSREVERFFASLSPMAPAPERMRAIAEDITEIRMNVNCTTREKLEEVKSLLSHKNPQIAEIFEMGLELLLRKHRPVKKSSVENGLADKKESEELTEAINDASLPPTRSRYIEKAVDRGVKSRYIAKAVRAEVKTRDKGKCQYKDAKTGRVCGSQFYIQYDHIQPHAMGGPSTTENLRLLCANHNKFAWERISIKLN